MSINLERARIVSNLISTEGLIRKALEHFNLELLQRVSDSWVSAPFATYKIEGIFLVALERNNFSLEKRVDGVTTLCDNSSQNHMPGCNPSNYWNFWCEGKKQDEIELDLKLGVRAVVSSRDRGIILQPQAGGGCLSPMDFLPQLRVFQTITEFDHSANPIVKKMVDGQGKIVVGWTDIGLGGIRDLHRLFEEFCDGNDIIKTLANSNLSPFDPTPFDKQAVTTFYIPEPCQRMLFWLWSEQLDHFKAKF